MSENLTNEFHKSNEIHEFKVEPIMVLVLGIVTCGLYLIYWNMQIAKVINSVTKEESISQPIAIFSGCCMPVNIYFYYLVGKTGLPKIYEKTGVVDKDQSMILMIMGFLLPQVAAMMVQGDVNKLYE
jgi:hypothetical protein